jgi:hypothetical protein
MRKNMIWIMKKLTENYVNKNYQQCLKNFSGYFNEYYIHACTKIFLKVLNASIYLPDPHDIGEGSQAVICMLWMVPASHLCQKCVCTEQTL